ncbi:aspartyl protease [Haematobacter massiliensis]|uniref:Aspartyl protease n=1 Tax=Haematobacter massiliensis TaxID=195105 RepID=A0A086Y7N1_9RHOB|nr:TIGR02281 family clan AA aspartic protease [Haematobacter massiliensis]KFI30281.1 aspartyl protease [Haematobacter massiliensis]
MSGNDVGQFIYLMLLLAAVGGSFLLGRRGGGMTLLRHAALWGLIFFGVLAVIGLWGDIRSTVMPRQQVMEDGARIEVPRGRDGHFHLTLEVDGTPVSFIVDTGASNVVLSREDARAIGLDPDELPYFGQAMTANGLVRTARVRLEELRLGPHAERNVTAWVSEGEMPGSLLGMDYLRRFERLEIAGDRMILTR